VEIDAEGRARQVPLPNPMKEERLHFAFSTDGRHWQPLNGNRPVWDQWLRDPFLQRGTDGIWHLLATGGERRRGTNETNLGPAFTPAKVLFAPPYSVIDGTLLEHGATYYLFHKEEEFSAKTGERRAIRLATADRLEGPYRIHEGPLNQSQIAPVITGGPAVMPDPRKPGWLLLYDYCMSNRYGISSSPDLIRWSIEEPVSLPPDARHGSVVRLTVAEAAALCSSFPEKKD